MKNKCGHHRIEIDEEMLAREFEEMMDEVYLLYHCHPTCIKPVKLTDDDPDDPGLYAGDVAAYAGYK